ncbi:hypothetical protein BV22DRAFT_1030074 [Leucogyrophana mollusca]|uniref:Uncharacterized protein n=1 Tax=Leucogyrophana mollusca TaxID=85980 RepID=A0ACB8BUC0_9AGAM|nr:hypothetical protein BV22DRAFT_1030074 [Leucogyrophana mollusca]
MHRRKSSKEDAEPDDVPFPLPAPPSLQVPTSPSRSRHHSTPAAAPARPPPPPLTTTGTGTPPTSPFRTTFPTHHAHSHSRARSISSGPFIPSVPSPLASSFPVLPVPEAGGGGRRHTRLHSRNLSIFFPRPHATIAEDDTRPPDLEAPAPPPILIPSAHSEPALQQGRELSAQFTFGRTAPPPTSSSAPTLAPRKGHHHKHSLSHNFFSFLEPGQAQTLTVPVPAESLHTTPTPTPISPWSPVSTLSNPDKAQRARSKSKSPSPQPPLLLVSRTSSPSGVADPSPSPANTTLLLPAFLAQFALGALLWVRGQQIGSLACTGLGYWVVFDAFGIGIRWRGSVGSAMADAGTGYAPLRTQTVLLFAQSVYLVFASVYVCKETVEHVLLSAGSVEHGDGHHHHAGDEGEVVGIVFPMYLLLTTLLALLGTSLAFGHHDVLVGVTNKRIPSPISVLRTLLRIDQGHGHVAGRGEDGIGGGGGLTRVLSNPYALPPMLFCVCILGAGGFLDVAHTRPFDLALAALETGVTFNVAYSACVVLGGVLLQTAPARGIGIGIGIGGKGAMGGKMTGMGGMGSKMDAFWRVVREIERHEQVVHLPAPHVWQVVPAGQPVPLRVRAKEDGGVNGHTNGSGNGSGKRNGHGNGNGQAIHPSVSSDSYFLGAEYDHIHKSRQNQNQNHTLHQHQHQNPAPTTHAPAHAHAHAHDPAPTPATLIVTLALHVRADLPDGDVLRLTRWAWERVVGAFGAGGERKRGGMGTGMEVEVTVGVVRG